MKNILLLFIPVLFTVACNRSSLNDNNPDNPFEWLKDSMHNVGFNKTEDCKLPHGISDTLIYGYTDRSEGLFYDKKLRLKTLKISGIGFEKKENSWTKKIIYYRFNFQNEEEKTKFEGFQFYCEQYQTHGKNQVKFFQKDSVWFLEFLPMP